MYNFLTIITLTAASDKHEYLEFVMLGFLQILQSVCPVLG